MPLFVYSRRIIIGLIILAAFSAACHSGNWLKIEQLFIPSLPPSLPPAHWLLLPGGTSCSFGPYFANCHFDSNDYLGVTGDSFSSFKSEICISMSSSSASLGKYAYLHAGRSHARTRTSDPSQSYQAIFRHQSTTNPGRKHSFITVISVMR